MKYFSCQPDSHNAFGSLTNCTLTYFTVDCPRYRTYTTPFAAPAAAAAATTTKTTRTTTTSVKRGVAEEEEEGGGAERGTRHCNEDGTALGSAAAFLPSLGMHAPPGFSSASPPQETKAHVQNVVLLPDCFHAQSSCFSMANRSLFGTELAFVGTSHGLLALVVVADKAVVFAPGKDPETLRDAEKRQRYHQFTRAGGSGGYASSTTSAAVAAAAASSRRRRRHSRQLRPDTYRFSSHYADGDGAPRDTSHPRQVQERELVGEGDGTDSGNDGAETGGSNSEPSLGSSYPSLSGGYHSGSSTTGSVSASPGAGGGGGAGGSGSHAHKRRSMARPEVPTTITWLRDKPQVLVGYSSGRVQWYQVRLSPSKQQQLSEPSLEEPYRAAIPAGALIHHINDPTNTTNARVTHVYDKGKGDGVVVELLTGCVLPDSGALLSSDYFPSNGCVVVGGERCIALFSPEQPEAPLCRLENFGCSFLYCHPFLPLVGTLSWGWNTIGPCYHCSDTHSGERGRHGSRARRHATEQEVPTAATARSGCALPKSDAGGVFVGNPNGYGGGCLLNIIELEETPLSRRSRGGRGHAGASAGNYGRDADVRTAEGWADGGGREEPEGDEDLDAVGAGRAEATEEDRQHSASDAGADRPRPSWRFRHVQQRLMESRSPRYGAYFSFSWKFSFDLELGVCNVEEGLVHVLRFHRRTAPLVSATILNSSDDAIDRAAGFPYQLVHEHRLRLPLHSLVNVEYVSAATSVLVASRATDAATASTTIGGGGAGNSTRVRHGHANSAAREGSGVGPWTTASRATRVVEARHEYHARAVAALRPCGRGGPAGVRISTHAAPLSAMGPAAPRRFAALFHAQETLAHSAMLMTLSADAASGREGSGGGGCGVLSLRGNGSSLSALRGHDANPQRGASSLGAAALVVGGTDELAGTFNVLDSNSEVEMRGTPPRSGTGGAGAAGGTAVSLKESILAAQLLHPMTASHAGAGGKHRRGGGEGGKGRRRGRQAARTASQRSPSLLNGGGSVSASHPSRSAGNACGSFGEVVDLRTLVRVGPGSTSSIVGMNAAGEVASVPVEMEAIATWHEEGSVFVGLGATICAADLVTVQGIERQMKRRVECGFRLNAEENVRALQMVARRSVRNTYSGLNNEGSTTTMSDLSTVFTFVAVLMQVGLVGAIGDVPSVCELLVLQEKGSEDARRAEAILTSAHTKLPQAVLDLRQQRQQQRHRMNGGTSEQRGKVSSSGGTLREIALLLLLHILNWLPPNVDMNTGQILFRDGEGAAAAAAAGAGSSEAAFILSEDTSTEQEVERAVAVQVLHSRFAAGAAILRRFGHTSASYHAMANLIASHEDTLSAIRESDAHVRETFLTSLSPWLLAVFLHLCADGEDTQNYRARIYGNVFLPLWDRVAIALILEPDTARLLHVLHGTLLRDCTRLQALMLVHGISAATYPIMQEIVDGTGDFQLAACLYARIGVVSPQFRLLFPGAAGALSSPTEETASHRGQERQVAVRDRTESHTTPVATTAGNGRARSADGDGRIGRGAGTRANGVTEDSDGLTTSCLPATALLHVVTPSAAAAARGEAQPSSSVRDNMARASRSSTHRAPSSPLLDTARLAASCLPPPPASFAVPTRVGTTALSPQRLVPLVPPQPHCTTFPLSAAAAAQEAGSPLHSPAPLPTTPQSIIAAWADAGAGSVLPPFFHKHERDVALGFPSEEAGASIGSPTSEAAVSHPGEPTAAASAVCVTDDGHEADMDDCPWVWWVAGYRAFLDSEQAFVERTMFDVACQRLREEGEAILARAAVITEAATAAAAAGGVGGATGTSLISLLGTSGPLQTGFLSASCSLRSDGSRGGVRLGRAAAASVHGYPSVTVVIPGTHSTGAAPPSPGAPLPSLSLRHMSLTTAPTTPPRGASPAQQRAMTLRRPASFPSSPITRRDGMPEALLVAKAATTTAAAATSCSSVYPSPSPLVTAEQYRLILGALSHRTPRCSVCLDPVHVHQRDCSKSLAWCTTCLHGGHADHMQQWFAKHRMCPVQGCRCHCDEDVSLC